MQIDKSIAEDLIYTRKRPNMDKQAWARFLKDYMQESKLSLRQFCKEYNIPKSTLTGWLCNNKITKEQYGALKDRGIPEKVIQDTLKSIKDTGDGAVLKIEDNYYKGINSINREMCRGLECLIDDMIDSLKPFAANPPKNENGLMLKLSQLREIVTKIMRKI